MVVTSAVVCVASHKMQTPSKWCKAETNLEFARTCATAGVAAVGVAATPVMSSQLRQVGIIVQRVVIRAVSAEDAAIGIVLCFDRRNDLRFVRGYGHSTNDSVEFVNRQFFVAAHVQLP